MNFMDLAKRRYSVRKFQPTPIPEESLQRILDAGCLAPTAKNLQPQRILVLKSAEALEQLKQVTPCHFDAPLAMLICYDTEACWTRPEDQKPSGDIDASIVTTHMIFQAEEEGIGSTWVMKFDPFAAREVFQLPAAWEPTAVLVMGYPAETAHPSHLHETYADPDTLIFSR